MYDLADAKFHLHVKQGCIYRPVYVCYEKDSQDSELTVASIMSLIFVNVILIAVVTANVAPLLRGREPSMHGECKNIRRY